MVFCSCVHFGFELLFLINSVNHPVDFSEGIYELFTLRVYYPYNGRIVFNYLVLRNSSYVVF